ncbi:MAG: lysostaphin resistance A-like protein [Planctomycetota bacterium]
MADAPDVQAQAQTQTAATVASAADLPSQPVIIVVIVLGAICSWLLIWWLRRTTPPQGAPPLGPRRPYLFNVTWARDAQGEAKRPLVPEDDKPEAMPQWGVMEFALGIGASIIITVMLMRRLDGSFGLPTRLMCDAGIRLAVTAGLLWFIAAIHGQNLLAVAMPRVSFRGVWKHMLVITLTGFFAVLAVNLIYQVVSHALGVPPPKQIIVQKLLASPPSADPQLWIAVVVSAGVVAPLVEEIMFRGVLYVGLRKLVGVPMAIVFSALLFALMHDAGHVPLVALGMLLAWSYERTRNLAVPIVFHITFNAVSLIAMANGMAT